MGCDTQSVLLCLGVIFLCLDIDITLATIVPGYLEVMDLTDAVGFTSVLGLPAVFP